MSQIILAPDTSLTHTRTELTTPPWQAARAAQRATGESESESTPGRGRRMLPQQPRRGIQGPAESRSQGAVESAAKKPGGRGRGRGHRMLLQQPRRLLQQHPHITLHVGVTGCCCSSRDVAAAAAANEAVDRGRGHRKLVQQPRRLLQQHLHSTVHVGVAVCCCSSSK